MAIVPWQANSQIIGTLVPGKVYKLSVWFNTTFTHYGYINLHDRNWKQKGGGVGRSFMTVGQGTNEWSRIEKRIMVPLVDDMGDSTLDDAWSVILYSHYPNEDPNPVYYDNISLIEIDTSTIPSMYSEIEEMPGWTGSCRGYTDVNPLAPWNQGMIYRDQEKMISGDSALVLSGNKTVENSYTISLPLKPDTRYRLSAWMRIENRTAYNYLDLDYPAWMTEAQPGTHTALLYTRGIWCGRYSLEIRDTDRTDFSVLQPDIIDHPYISHSNVEWFREESYIQTTEGSCEITITIGLEGFLGSLWIDNILLEEVWSFIDDEYLNIPIETEFQGMRMEEISYDPLQINTNAATFSLGDGHVSFTKEGEEVCNLSFFASDFLIGIETRKETGFIIIENDNIVISIGADSSAIFKLKKNTSLTIEGPKPGYHSFEAGIVFSTDYSKGVLFSPIYPSNILKGMPYSHEPTSDYLYSDQQFEKEGLKFWDVLSNFSQYQWKIRYSFNRGDGFLTSIFPPKEMDLSKLHKEKMSTAGIDINSNPDSDHSYYVQKFKERNNIILLWMDDYAASSNDRDPPDHFFVNGNYTPVSPNHPEARAVPFVPVDVAGPYTVEQKESLHKLIKEAHRQGCMVIVYMSPRFFYTSDIDVFLRNLGDNLNEFDLDGVYFDGYFSADPLKNLELVRRTRNLLGDRFYCQHNSWTDTVIRRSDHFRVPFYEAYADRLWVGEGVKKVDEDMFRLNYCGLNVSNTISTLIAEIRPVNYSLPKEDGLSLAITAQEQIDRQLEFYGEFRLPPFGYYGYLLERRYQTTHYFDAAYYLRKGIYDGACSNGRGWGSRYLRGHL